MTDSLVVLIASPLEPEHVATMRAVDPRIEVWHAPDWLPRVRSVADHHGHPLMRAPEQEARWRALLAHAAVLFDVDHSHLNELPIVAPRLKWVQCASAGMEKWY